MMDPLIFSNKGPLLTIIHANGYPLEAYQAILKPLLLKFKVVGYSLRPFWPGSDPAQLRDWRDFRDDYLDFLEDFFLKQNHSLEINDPRERVIAIGHSVGAMTSLLSAIQRPELFKALVLIEPVLFPPWQGRLMDLLSPLKLMRHFYPLILKTLNRKTSFPDPETMFANFRSKPIFSRLPDEVLIDYVNGLSRELPDGSLELRYSPEWEVRIYETSGIADKVVWRNLEAVTCPVLVIRGIDTDALKEQVMEVMVKRLPLGRSATIADAGHLVPLEKPDQTGRLIIDFLESL